MTQLYVHSFNRRSTQHDHNGVRSMQTERVNQLGLRRLRGFEILEEEIVPAEHFMGVVLGTSDWKSKFEPLDTQPLDASGMKSWPTTRTLVCGALRKRKTDPLKQYLYLKKTTFLQTEYLDEEVVPAIVEEMQKSGDWSKGPAWRSRFSAWIPRSQNGTMTNREEK